MAGPTGVLGYLPFMGGQGSAFSFHEITKTRKNAWAKHKILCGNDLLEDVGFEPIEIDLQMKFFAPYTMPPSAALAMLEGYADAKVPLPLIVGGVPLGRGILTLYVVESISSKMTKFSGSSLIVLECSVKLCEYTNPPSIGGPLGALASIPGLSGISGALSGVSGAIGAVTGAIGGVAGALGGIGSAVSGIGGAISGIGGALSGVTGVISSVSSVANSVSATVGGLSSGLAGAMNFANGAVGAVTGALSNPTAGVLSMNIPTATLAVGPVSITV